jgi:hypothetical protein
MDVSSAAALSAAFTQSKVQDAVGVRVLQVAREMGKQMVNLVEQTAQMIEASMQTQADGSGTQLDVRA